MKHRALALMFCLGAVAPTLAQQSPNDIEMLSKYTGTWAVDCGKSAGTRLTVATASLALDSAGKKAQVAAPMAAFSYYGRAKPPAGFEAALLGESGRNALTFLAMKDTTGPYLLVDADTPLEKQFGKPALAGKFRRCP
jgi:hypothetical protein